MNKENWCLAGKNENETLLGNDYFLNEDVLGGTVLWPLNRINIFVGANNSGKSRLMRRAIRHGTTCFDVFEETFAPGLVHEINLLLSKLDLSGAVARIRIDLLFREVGLKGVMRIIGELKKSKGGRTISNEILNISYEKIIDTIEARVNIWVNYDSSLGEGTFFPKLKKSIDQGFEYEIQALLLFLELQKIEVRVLLDKSHYGHQFSITGVGGYSSEDILKLIDLLQLLRKDEFLPISEASKIYIPILRSANRLWLSNKTSDKNPDPILFETTTRKNYEDELVEDLEIFTGQKLFYKIVAARNGRAPERKAFEEFEAFLSNEFFSGKRIEIVAELGDLSEVGKVETSVMAQSIQIHIEGDEDRKIHNLGDGIQALIMLTFPIFMAKKETHIFIEEPELNLHPGMQRIFLDVISKHNFIVEKNLKFFMTTHSNHFLDLTITENAPVSIFTLQRTKGDKTDSNAKFRIKNVFAGEKELLTELGVQNSSVFIGNCSIWVEGITDRKYIRRYLEAYSKAHKYKKAFREDLHFVFFEYAGSNLVHYSFEDIDTADIEKIKGMRLSNSILVIADKDDGKEAKHTFFSKLNGVNFQYRKLETALEIENLLTKEVVEKALPAVFPKLAEKAPEKIKAFSLGKIDERKFVEEYLFESIVKSFGKAGFTEVYPSVKVPKTLPSLAKSNLCEYVCTTNPITWEQMSDEAQELTIEIYEFISRNNPTL